MNKSWEEAKPALLSLIPIEKYDCPGIYCIKVNNHILYIGKSNNMRNRVASHIYHISSLDEEKSNKYKILHELQNFFSIDFDVLTYCTKSEIALKEAILINQYLPLLNYQIPRIDNPKSFVTNKRARTLTTEEVLEYLKT